MPIYSMTGFARVQVRVHDQLVYTLSVKSVNHRFLDIQLRLPFGPRCAGDGSCAARSRKAWCAVTWSWRFPSIAQRSRRRDYNRELVAGYHRSLQGRATSSRCRRARPQRDPSHAGRIAKRESRATETRI